MKLSLDIKDQDQNTQPLINSARMNESDIVFASIKPTNFSSFDSVLNKDKDDYFLRQDRQKSFDSPLENIAEAPTQKKNACGMRLKSDAPSYAAVPILGLFASQVCATVFMNSQVIFLLRSNSTFMSEDQIGRMTSLTLTWQLVAQMTASVFAGYGFDLFGRRFMIAISFVLLIGALIWTPYTS